MEGWWLGFKVCTKTFSRDKRDVWVKSRIEIILKKVTLAYQQIIAVSSVTVTATNIYNKLLLQRIRPHLADAYFYKRPHLWCLTRFWIHLFLYPLLRINQHGFTAGRSTIAQILSLRILIEAIKEGQLTNVFTFDDFSKAFDSSTEKADRDIKILWNFIKNSRCNEHTYTLIIKSTGLATWWWNWIFPILVTGLQETPCLPFCSSLPWLMPYVKLLKIKI